MLMIIVQDLLFPRQGHTNQSSACLGNRCPLAAEQNVVRGRAGGK